VRWLRGRTLRRMKIKVQRSSLFVLFCLNMHVGSEYDVSRAYSRAWSLGHVELQASTACAPSPLAIFTFSMPRVQSQAEKPRAESPRSQGPMHSNPDSVKYKGTSAGRRGIYIAQGLHRNSLPRPKGGCIRG
jgi:hypothetical protein